MMPITRSPGSVDGGCPISEGSASRWCTSRPSPPVSMSWMIVPISGPMAERPRRRPTVSELVTTDDAPDWRTSGTLTCSRTATITPAVGFSCRTVSVARTAASSRSREMMIWRALLTSARRSTSRRVASPWKAARPSALASSTATALPSSTTILSARSPWRRSVLTALRPFVP